MSIRRVRAASVLALAACVALVGNAPLSPAAEAPQSSGHVALVIGNSAYDNLPKLPECAAAARTMVSEFRRLGFDVIERLDASNGEIGGGLAALAHRLEEAANASTADGAPQRTTAAIYACGYASAFDNRAFLLPVSIRIERPADLLTQGVLIKLLGTAPAAADARTSLVLLDMVHLPGSPALPDLAPLAHEASDTTHGIVAATSDAPAAGATTNAMAATKLASTAAAVLGDGPAEVGAVVASVQRALARAGDTALAVGAPLTPTWLAEPPRDTAPNEAAPVPAMPVRPGTPSAAMPIREATAPSPTSPPLAQLPDEPQQTDQDRRLIQAALARLGYYSGSPDGVYGSETRAAMRRFQHEIGAEQTGHLTAEQAAKLMAHAG
jgi:hypothetical protein